MVKTEQAENTDTLKKAIDAYLKRGFGSMNKHDFEVYIFNELLKTKYRDKSNYEISRDLKISESKVKSLYYEANLRYAVDFDQECQSAFIEAIKKIKFQQAKKDDEIKLSFVIEKMSVRKYLEHKLKEKGRFVDFHFNTEVITVSSDDFFNLVEECAGGQIRTKIQEEIKNGNIPSIKEVIKDFIEEHTKVFGGSASNIISLTVDDIIEFVTTKKNNKSL